jgi:myo-inositol-1-phosphate synthase
VNALFAQRQAIINVMRACLGLCPENHMTLEHRFESTLEQLQKQQQEAHAASASNPSLKKQRLH